MLFLAFEQYSEIILWHAEPLLGNDIEMCKYITVVMACSHGIYWLQQ
jgi:hypothetical protein